MLSVATVGIVLVAMSQDPLFIHKKPQKIKTMELIVRAADKNHQDPYELLAIAAVESNFNPKAVSWAGAIGLFQVMCKYWYKPLKYHTIQQCEVALFDPHKNVAAGVHVLTTYRKYFTQCRGTLAYRCYYAGQGWNRRTGRLKKKIERYEKKVLNKKEILHTYYSDLIEAMRSKIKTRS
tara:strand:- start:342 stop:878 length:537 start_codon:yes stop_codon:yes gene_type:complete